MKLFSAIALFGFLAYTNAFATSFDCHKAHSKTEKLACSDPELSRLDDMLASAYKHALVAHPLPSYVKARQREWVRDIEGCGDQNFNGGSEARVKPCMKKLYEDRIANLTNVSKMVVFANSSRFSYEAADLVVEFYLADGVWHLSVWGGFVEHPQFSQDEGKPIYLGCTFDGTVKSPSSGQAADADKRTIRYRQDANQFIFLPGTDICEGLGRLPDEPLKRVSH